MRNSVPVTCAAALACAVLFVGAGCRDAAPRQAAIAVGDRAGALIMPPDLAGQLSASSEIVRRQFQIAWSEFNLNDPRSDIAKINRVAGTYRLQVSFNTFRAIDLAHYYSQLTGGAYDLTVLPALEAWGFAGPIPESPPSDEELAALMELIGLRHIQLAEQGAIALVSPGARIAPGSLAYAYGVDLAIVELRRQEIDRAFVTWDRYARALGRLAPDTPWRHPIRNPFDSAPLGEIALDAAAPALAVIGLRDRTVTIEGREYGDVIDPRTARPAEDTALAAVRAPTCLMAHALAHALIVLGVEEGTSLLNEFPDCEALVIPDRQPMEAWATQGWIDAFTPSPAWTGVIRRWDRPEIPVNSDEAVEEE